VPLPVPLLASEIVGCYLNACSCQKDEAAEEDIPNVDLPEVCHVQ
jgi:hypothetical protein